MEPGTLARVVYGFASNMEGELNLTVGSIVQVIRKVDRHWTYGCCDGKFGNFPTGFIAEIPSPPHAPGEQLFVALDAFTAQELEDLAFQKGDIIVGTQAIDDNWWRGKIDHHNGIFPLNLVWKVDMSLLPEGETKKGKVSMRAKVNADLKAQLDEEIDLWKGDIVHITEIIDKDWYRGESNGKVGIFPSAFVTPIEETTRSTLPDLLSFQEINGKSTSNILKAFDPIICDSDPEDKCLPPPDMPPPLPPTDILLQEEDYNEPRCMTIYPFSGEFANELSFGVGMLVKLLRRVDSQWFEGELNGKVGLFPTCYVQVLVDLPADLSDKTQEVLTLDKSAIALFDFHPQMDGDLGLREGELVTVLQKLDDCWYRVRNSVGQSGVCPASYLQMSESGTSAHSTEYFQRQLSLPIWSRTSKEKKETKNLGIAKYPASQSIPQTSLSLTENVIGSYQSRAPSFDVSTPMQKNINSSEQFKSHATNALGYQRDSGRRSSCPVSPTKKLPPPRPPPFTLQSNSPKNEEKALYRGRIPHRPAPPVPTLACRPATVTPKLRHRRSERRPNKRAMSDLGTRMSEPAMSNSPESAKDIAPEDEMEQCQLRVKNRQDLIRTDSENSLYDPEERNRQKRKLILEELLQTERSFVQDMIFCKDTFLGHPQEFKDKGVNVDALFGQLDPVLNVNKQLLYSLEDTIANPSEYKSIGICFKKVAADMKKAYGDYCVNHNDVINLLEKYEESEEIAKFIQAKLGSGGNPSYFNLSSILIKPVQRVLKYPLLLNELVKATEDNTPDKPDLIAALASMTDVANAINECKRRKDLVVKYRKESDGGLSAKISKLSIHSVVKKGHRIQMRLSSHLGLVSVTKDHAFDDMEQKFRDVERTIKQLLKDADAFCINLKECVQTQFQLAEHIGDFYEERRVQKDVDGFRTIQREIIGTIWPDFDRVYESKLKRPLLELLHLYEGPNKLIEKRNDKLLDYDGASQRLEKNKDINRGKQLRDDLEVTKKDYSALNAQLIEELPKLIELSIAIVAECVGAFLFARKKFIGMTAKHLVTMTEEVPNLRIPEKDVLDSFSERHEAILEKMKAIGMIPKEFQPSPRLERAAAKEKGHSEKHRSTSTQAPGVSHSPVQSSSQRAYLQGRYGAEMLFTATQGYVPTNESELALGAGDLVAVIIQKDPMGTSNHWFVDNGTDRGLVPSHILSPVPQLSPQQQKSKQAQATASTLPSNYVERIPDDPPPRYSYYDTVPEETETQLRYENSPLGGYEAIETNGGGRYDVPCDFPYPEVQDEEEEEDGFAMVNMEQIPLSKNDPNLTGVPTIQVGSFDNSYYVATYPFQATGPNVLSLTLGQVVLVHHRQDLQGNSEWWFVEDRYGNHGYVPASYLCSYQSGAI